MTAFDDAFRAVVGVEGNFSDDPTDSGGATKYGITERVARAHGYTGPMKDLPLATAKAIYKVSYWDPLVLDQVELCSAALCDELFEAGVNCGIEAPSRWLQRTLNVLNQQAKLWDDLTVDGHLGSASIRALQAFIKLRGAEGVVVLLTALNCFQGSFYISLAEQRAKDERFVYGWLLQRVRI